jgi:cytochrome c biogenesis factor
VFYVTRVLLLYMITLTLWIVLAGLVWVVRILWLILLTISLYLATTLLARSGLTSSVYLFLSIDVGLTSISLSLLFSSYGPLRFLAGRVYDLSSS